MNPCLLMRKKVKWIPISLYLSRFNVFNWLTICFLIIPLPEDKIAQLAQVKSCFLSPFSVKLAPNKEHEHGSCEVARQGNIDSFGWRFKF